MVSIDFTIQSFHIKEKQLHSKIKDFINVELQLMDLQYHEQSFQKQLTYNSQVCNYFKSLSHAFFYNKQKQEKKTRWKVLKFIELTNFPGIFNLKTSLNLNVNTNSFQMNYDI